jgi:hypothetical protein
VIVHYVAGIQITAGQVSRQRCMWCGEVVEEKRWGEIDIPNVDGKSPEQVADEMFRGAWPEGWIAIIDDVRVVVTADTPGVEWLVGEVPAQSCVAIEMINHER